MSWLRALLYIGVASALFVQYYLDAKIPEGIKEKWTLKFIDACLKTGQYLDGNVAGPYSDSARGYADNFILLHMTGSPWGLGDDPLLKIQDTKYNEVEVRVYEPVSSANDDQRPVVIYFHGGGWSILSTNSYDPITRKIALETGFVVISVNYRLAPEHPYPAAFEDCVNVVEHVITNARQMGIDPSRIAVAGDSSGGNLAAAVSLRLQKKIRLQVIMVPPLQALNFNTTSLIENAEYLSKTINNPIQVSFWLNYAGIDRKYLSQFHANNHTSKSLKTSKYFKYANPNKLVPKYYIRTIELRDSTQKTDFGDEQLWNDIQERLLDPYFAPLMADDSLLKNSPKTYIMTAGYDIIRDDGIMYASRLKAAGVKVVIRNFPEAFHSAYFYHSGPLHISTGTRIMKDVTNFIKFNL